MSFGLLVPAGLAGTVRAAGAAGAAPDAAHGAQPAMFAALRWLQVRQRPQRRIRFEECRCSRCGCCCWPRSPCCSRARVLRVAGGGPGSWSHPASSVRVARAAVAAPDAQWRWLAPGFPALERDPPAGVQPVSSLLRELDATLRDDAPVTLVVPARLEGLDGERPALRRPGRVARPRHRDDTLTRSAAAPGVRSPCATRVPTSPRCAICVQRGGMESLGRGNGCEPGAHRHRAGVARRSGRTSAGWSGWFRASCRPTSMRGSRPVARRCWMWRPRLPGPTQAPPCGAMHRARRWSSGGRWEAAA